MLWRRGRRGKRWKMKIEEVARNNKGFALFYIKYYTTGLTSGMIVATENEKKSNSFVYFYSILSSIFLEYLKVK